MSGGVEGASPSGWRFRDERDHQAFKEQQSQYRVFVENSLAEEEMAQSRRLRQRVDEIEASLTTLCQPLS
jgi:putative hemolysin